jgi:carboxyl-terminal processing protease
MLKLNLNKPLCIAVLFLSFFVSCKKDNVDNSASGTASMARDSLYYIMNEWYLWYNLMPGVNKADYADPYELLEAMRYKPKDRWSFILNHDEYLAQKYGTFVGHGFRIGVDSLDNARIAMIYDNSDLYSKGVRRGWIVKKVNGTDIAPIIIARDSAAYSNLLGKSEAGITNTFVFQKPDGTEETISSTKSSFEMNTVLLADTLQLSSGMTGHLVFESFFYPAPTELESAFSFFIANDVKDLILDLRYNSGGSLGIAQTLASYIAGNSRVGHDFAILSFNNKHNNENFSVPFLNTSYSLDLQRIVVITSRSTASASEDVINGLRPFVNVVCIGDTTDGKPTGMIEWNITNQYYIYPVMFEVVNDNNEGDFYGGIIPHELAVDDITHDFGDRKELCLKEAINYLETGSVATKGVSTFRRYPQLSEKPEWMNNAFIFKNK